MFELHDYQNSLVYKARKSYVDGYKSPCIVAPCGAGKSVIISEIARMTTLKGN
ncbi:MAG TPA: DEAD/DEAH box helicase family protein, partial [Massilibacterium sp.]|nr:DEAD/DEAH box helicase family protein [Massilibacterium sp.]